MVASRIALLRPTIPAFPALSLCPGGQMDHPPRHRSLTAFDEWLIRCCGPERRLSLKVVKTSPAEARRSGGMIKQEVSDRFGRHDEK